MINIRNGTLVTLMATTLGGCIGLDPGTAESLKEQRLTIAEAEARFEPTETLIGPVAEHESELRERGIVTDAITIVDASGGRTIFPMPERTREFASRDEVRAFVARELGVDPEYEGEGWGGSYAMINASFWTDPRTRVRYRVVDPMLAYLGGVTGRLNVGGLDECVDADRECSRGPASYLVPEGDFTAVNAGTSPPGFGFGGIVGTFTSFFTRTYFPWTWARSGTNASINYGALPETEIRTNGDFVLPSGPTFFRLPWVRVTNNSTSNNYSSESAIWAAWYEMIEFQSDAACGCGTIEDPWLNASFATGNGPQNPNFCLTTGFNQCFVPRSAP